MNVKINKTQHRLCSCLWFTVQKYITSHIKRPKQIRSYLCVMMALRLLLLCAVLLYNTGSRAKDTVFVQTGASVQLDMQTHDLPAEFEEIFWENEKSNNIVKYYNKYKLNIYPSYKDRVDFNNKTFSLTLRNMQKTDSGVYTAKISGEFNRLISKHNVSVIDAVKAPLLTVNPGSSSTEPCNFTCKADHISITFIIYNSSSCSEKVTSSGIYTLSLNCTGDTIICNHSNPVSWKTGTQTVKLCTNNPEKRTSATESVLLRWLIPLMCICIFLLVLCAAVVGFCFHKKNKDAQQSNTVYAEVEGNNKPSKPIEMLAGSTNVCTVYDTTVKQPDVTMETSQTTPTPDSINQDRPADLTEESKPDKPTTVYCTIHQHPKLPVSETDNTIYAVVNKHTAGYESVH